jgi:flagellar M-ring protein FliF
VAPPQVTNETTNRAWEIGKDVTVTRGLAPRLRRLSVAVVIDKAALAKATPADIASLTRIVQGTVGYDSARGDVVELQLRGFAVPTPEPLQPWYEKPVVQDYAPLAGLALLLLVGGVIAALRFRKRGPVATPAATPIDGGELTPEGEPAATGIDYSEKLGTTRGLVTADADRATAVARQMLAAAT